SAGSDECLRLWDAVTGKQVATLPLPEPARGEVDRLIYHVYLSADGKQARAVFGAQGYFSLGGDGEVIQATDWLGTWELPGGTLLAKAPLQAVHGRYSCLSRDGKTLVTPKGVANLNTLKETVRLEGV